MCFSPTASFTASAVLLGIGVVTLTKVKRKNDLILAVIPLIFSVQQLIEGFIWVNAYSWHDVNINLTLSYAYLLFAYVLWPIWLPLSSYAVEPNPQRKKIIFWMAILGIIVAMYSLFQVIVPPIGSEIREHCIYYHVMSPTPFIKYFWGTIYILATCFSYMLSSYRSLQLLGALWLIALGVTLFFWMVYFTSVWCFFGAALSIVILWHFWPTRNN